MMLAALKLTLSPSIARASSAASSSQWSARAGELANAPNSTQAAASGIKRRNGRRNVMMKRPVRAAIEAADEASRKRCYEKKPRADDDPRAGFVQTPSYGRHFPL